LDYLEFLKTKRIVIPATGIAVPDSEINPRLFDFQKDIVCWALERGRAAIFADCGLGKTPMQLEWANHIHQHTGGNVLILAPLAVAKQTARESEKFDIPVTVCRIQSDVKPGINITNYEMLQHFDPDKFVGVVLDESSILKSFMGKTKMAIINAFKSIKYKLACTATPSPNDVTELLNHAEFLGIMRSCDALTIWFTNDTTKANNLRLKKHAEQHFWEWVSSWAVSISKPSDLGYSDDGYILPELKIIEHIIDVDLTDPTGQALFRVPDMSATAFHREKRMTARDRVRKTAEIVQANPDQQFVVWCDTNYEADELRKNLPEAVEIRGNDKVERKEQAAVDFMDGKIQVLISKPSIFGWGLNFQNCYNVVFCGLNFSYEGFYQAVRRFWRFGQKHQVNCHIVIGETERQILEAVRRKQDDHETMKLAMLGGLKRTQNIRPGEVKYKMDYDRAVERGENWTAILGDCVEEIKNIPDDSIGFEIFSPPFSSLYTYSDSYRDMGNVFDDEMFFQNYDYLVPDLYRVLMPGRLCAVHVKNLPRYKSKYGVTGIRDFRGDIIRAMEKHGFVYHSEVCIWKDPVREMQRTKAQGLLYKQLRKDSSHSRQGMAEYLVVFRKWKNGGVNPEPVTHTTDNFPLELWQRYASPVWFDIQQTNVLNVKVARDDRDEKHLAPLQLDVIERALKLWTNPGDLVFSPFMGIGSEGYMSLKMERKFIGIELKESYFRYAVDNLKVAESERRQRTLFDFVAEGAI